MKKSVELQYDMEIMGCVYPKGVKAVSKLFDSNLYMERHEDGYIASTPINLQIMMHGEKLHRTWNYQRDEPLKIATKKLILKEIKASNQSGGVFEGTFVKIL